MKDTLKQDLPNLAVHDGYISIPLADLLQYGKDSGSAEGWIDGLLEDPDARVRLIEAAGRRWGNLEDSDKRKLLEALKEQVHNAALDRVAERLAKLEWGVYMRVYNAERYVDFKHWLGGVSVSLQGSFPEAYNYLNSRHGLSSVFQTPPPAMEGAEDGLQPGQKGWRAARDHWRKLMAERYAAPKKAEEPDGEPESDIPY